MRDILFRGKRMDNGEWIYGHFFSDGDVATIFLPTVLIGASSGGWWIDDSFDLVYLETVGQYTGLTDKNGKKIFEGDILRITERGHTIDGGIVVFQNGYPGGWLIMDATYTSKCSLAMRTDVEVIGNIHDNPELLEVSK